MDTWQCFRYHYSMLEISKWPLDEASVVRFLKVRNKICGLHDGIVKILHRI